MRSGVAVAAVLALAGCAAPNPPPPADAAVTPPVGWRTQAGPVAPLAANWWQAFGDPVLDTLVERALAANPDIAIAAARVREARAQEMLSRAALFPTLDAGVSATDQRSLSALGQPRTSRVVSPVFQTSYEVDLFGRIHNQVDAARLSAEAAAAAHDVVRLSVAAATASGYVTLRGLDARLAIAQETVKTRAEALRIARNRAEAGYTSQLELKQADADYRSVTQLVPQLQLAITRQEDALALLLGETPQPIPRGLSLASLPHPALPDGLPSDLLRRRPDIAQAEYALAASDRSLAAARAQFLPQLRLTGSTGALLVSGIADPVAIWSLGGSILAPLFEGGRLRAGVEGAGARRDQAAYAYEKAVLNAFREVEDQLAAVTRLAQQRSELESQRTALAEALRHARNRYEAGYTSYLEQLDAQRALLAADLSLVQLQTDQVNALIALDQAAGGGWQS